MPPAPAKKGEKGGQPTKPQPNDISVKSPITKTATKKEDQTSGDQRRDAKKGDRAAAEKKANPKQKADIDDMDEIFAAKPSKSKKEELVHSGAGASASSGPDLTEIAKEAERYKGSGGPGYHPPQFLHGIFNLNACPQLQVMLPPPRPWLRRWAAVRGWASGVHVGGAGGGDG
jgi:hypothetical protein